MQTPNPPDDVIRRLEKKRQSQEHQQSTYFVVCLYTSDVTRSESTFVYSVFLLLIFNMYR